MGQLNFAMKLTSCAQGRVISSNLYAQLQTNMSRGTPRFCRLVQSLPCFLSEILSHRHLVILNILWIFEVFRCHLILLPSNKIPTSDRMFLPSYYFHGLSFSSVKRLVLSSVLGFSSVSNFCLSP